MRIAGIGNRSVGATDIAVLLVEDDVTMANVIARGLRAEGMEVFAADSVARAQTILIERTIDILLLDLTLKDGDGTDVLRFVRSTGRLIPAIVISARSEVDERIHTLGLGADDYLVKPFHFGELVARIHALRRRSHGSEQVATVGSLRVDLLQRKVFVGERPVDLTPREFDLLAHLVRHAGAPVSRDTLARDVLHVRSRATPVDNVIEVNVSRLRAKLEEAGVHMIDTVRGIGYRLTERP